MPPDDLRWLDVLRSDVMPAVPAHFGIGANRFVALWTVLGRYGWGVVGVWRGGVWAVYPEYLDQPTIGDRLAALANAINPTPEGV